MYSALFAAPLLFKITQTFRNLEGYWLVPGDPILPMKKLDLCVTGPVGGYCPGMWVFRNWKLQHCFTLIIDESILGTYWLCGLRQVS